MIIGEGTDVNEIQQVIQGIKPGQAFDLQLMVSEPVDLGLLEDDFIENGVQPRRIYQEGDTVHIQLQRPKTERIGFIWWIPLAAVGGIITLIYGWKIITMDPWDMLVKSLPFILIGAGVIYIIYQASKSPAVRQVAKTAVLKKVGR